MIAKYNISKHLKTKKCKNSNDKTAGKTKTVSSVTSTADNPPAVPAESKLLTINFKPEYDKMTETLNPKKENKSGKEKKYQCGACGATFDNLKDGKCPDCEAQLA